MNKKWKARFELPSDSTEYEGKEYKVKERTTVEIELDEDVLMMLLHDISFFHESIYEEDIKSFLWADADTGIYSRYKIKYRQIDFNEREAMFELDYDIY